MVKTIEMKNQMEEISSIIGQFEVFAEENELPMDITMKISLAFDDILSNIVQYAYTDERPHDILIDFKLYKNQVLIRITDDGIPFNPLLVNTPDTSSSLEERTIGGLGIHLVKNVMDDCRYRRRINQNILTLVKKLK